MKIPSLAGFFFAFLFPIFQHLCVVMNRLLFCCFILCQLFFCQAQNQGLAAIWSVGINQEFQKFNQFSCARVQFTQNNNQFALNIGISPQKATQHIFAPSASIDYARLWKIHGVCVGPAIVFSLDSHVFGTRFMYLHASMGYRFVSGKKWQIFQESTFGPTEETFTYLDQKNQHFTWNYHVKLGLQYALR
jgi:hypothetical protein